MGNLFNMSPFQLGTVIVFCFFIIGGLAVLGLGSFGGGSGSINVTIWGTMPQNDFNSIVEQTSIKDNDLIRVEYAYKDPSTYDTELIDALASGEGPDVFFLSHKSLLKHRNKITPISYETFSRRRFSDVFVRGADIFLDNEGIYAMPLLVDPMVMYWNTTLFSNAAISQPPQYWDEFRELVPRLTVTGRDLTISQSAFALGEFRNITHASDILSALFLQNNIALARRNTEGDYEASFRKSSGTDSALTALSVLNFFTDFSNPSSRFYTWNRSLPATQNYFIQSDLGLYLGFASEYSTIRQKNPNLSFDVTAFPQTRASQRRTTYGDFTGLAIAKSADDPSGAYRVIRILTSQEGAQAVSRATQLPPVRVDAFQETPGNTFMPVFQQMALWSDTWLEPQPEDTDDLFRDMVENVTSSRLDTTRALDRLESELNELYERVQ